MSSQLAAQLRILAGAGGATTSRPAPGKAGAPPAGAPASSRTLAAIAHAAPGSTATRYRASFLFAADVAAATDSATVHSMGASGLEQLSKLEPRLRSLAAALAGSSSFDRDAHQTAQLASVQQQVNQCIALLAPYFMLKPTHKVLEFLIRRYSVHIYNISALLAAFLPYHESALFARLLQVLHLHLAVPAAAVGGANAEPDTHKLFGFLEGAQREGAASITRHTLVQRCMHDAAFLRWLVGLVALKPSAGQGHMQTMSNTTITFYTTLMLELLSTLRGTNNANRSDAKDAIARTIVQHALEVLNAHVNAQQVIAAAATPAAGAKPAAGTAAPPRELVFSALLLLSQAALVHSFGPSLDLALFLLLKSVPSARGDQTLAHPVCMALLALTQNQHVPSAPPKGVSALIASQGVEAGSPFVSALANLSLQYDIAHVLRVLLPQVAAAHVGEQRKHAQLLLSEIVTSLPLGDAQVHSLVSTLLHSYVDAHRASDASEWNSKEVSALRKLVLLVQDRYSTQLESVVYKLLEEAASSSASDAAGEAEDVNMDGDEQKDGSKASKKKKKALLQSSPLLALVHLLFEGSAHEVLVGMQGADGTANGAPAAASVLTCLQSPLAHVRIRALQAVDNMDVAALSASDDSSLSSHLHTALLSKLSDADASVVRATLRLKSLPRLVSFDDLVAALGAILSRFGGVVDSDELGHSSAAKVLEAAFKVAAKIVAQVGAAEGASSAEQGAQLHSLMHTLFPFLFELALARPNVGVSAKLVRAAHELMVLLSTQAKLPPRHTQMQEDGAEEEDFTGFLLCGLFAKLPAVASDADSLADPAAIQSHNRALLAAWSSNFVSALSTGAAVESEVLNALSRVASAVTAVSRSSNKVGEVRSNAPTTAFALLQMLNQAVQQLASTKKADAALFLRVARDQQRVLASVWSSFTAEQRRMASTDASGGAASASSALVSPVSFVSSASGSAMTPASFPAFVRSSIALLVSVVSDFVSTHPSSQESATAFLRELYASFVADAESVNAFGAHIALLCKTHLNGGALHETVKFLVPMLQGSGAGTPASLQVSVRSFHLLHALLGKHGHGKTKLSKEDGALLADLAATFLLACASPARAVRHAAVMAVPALGAALSGSDKKHAISPLVSQLLAALYGEKEELLSASSGDVARTDDVSLRESATDASVQFMQAFVQKHMSGEAGAPSTVFKSDSQRVELYRFLTGIAIRFASTPGSVWSGWRLLQVLRRLPHERVADLMLPHLASILSASVRSAALTSVAVELLEQIDAAVVQADSAAAFGCIMQALHMTAGAGASDDEDAPTGSTRRAVSAIHAAALSRISVEVFNLLDADQQEQLFDALLRLSSRKQAGVGALVALLPFDSAVFAKRLVLTAGGKKKKSQAAAGAGADLSSVQSVLELLQLKGPEGLRSPFALVAPLFQLLDHLNAQTAEGGDATRLQALEYAKQLSMAALNKFLAAPAPVVPDAEQEKPSRKSKKHAAAATGFNVKDINVDAVVTCLSASGEEASAAPAVAEGASTAAGAAVEHGALHTLNVSVENTRTHALTLLSLIGQAHPELIVDVLLPIFQTLLTHSTRAAAKEAEEAASRPANALSTAMDVDNGAAVASEEPYALRLLNRLISTVLPSIVRAGLQWSPWQLLAVFVDSLSVPRSTAAVPKLKKKAAAESAGATLVNPRRLHLFHNLLTSLQAPASAEDADAQAGSSYLHVVVSLLLARSVTAKKSLAKDAAASEGPSASSAALVEFAHVLCEQFGEEPGAQITAFNHMLQLLGAEIASEHGETLTEHQKNSGVVLRLGGKGSKAQKTGANADAIGVTSLNQVLRTSAQRSSWQKAVLSFLSQHLARLSFAQQIYLHAKRTQSDVSDAAEGTEHSAIQTAFLHLFEQLFARLRSSLQLHKSLATKEDATAQALSAHFLLLSTHTKQALLHLNGLLTMPNFVRILKELFRISGGGDASARDIPLLLQALSLLHSKLLAYKDRAKIHAFAGGRARKVEDEEEDADVDLSDPHSVERAAYYRSRKAEQRLLVSLLPALEALLSMDPAVTPVSAEEASMAQSALLNLDVLASSFGHMRQFQAEFVAIVPTILKLTLLPKADDDEARALMHSLLHSHAWQHISTSALLCLATLVSSFQHKAHVLMLEFVPTLVPNTLHILQRINAPEEPAEKAPAGKKAKGSAAKARKRKHGEESEEEDDESVAEDAAPVLRTRTLDTLVAPLLQLSALSVLQACIVSVPELLSPYLADLLQVLLFPGYHTGAASAGGASSMALLAAAGATNATTVATAAGAAVSSAAAASAAGSSSIDHASVSSVVSQSLSSLIAKVPSRTLLPYLFNHFKVASAQGYASLRRLFQLLGLVVATLAPDSVKQHFKLIFKFVLAAAQQLRKSGSSTVTDGSRVPDASGGTLSEAEDALIAAFLELTLKLNETSFKGLFLKMLQWVGPIPESPEALSAAAAGGAQSTTDFLHRSLVLFKLVRQLTMKLKGIFVTYYGYILDHCVLFLSAAQKGKKNEAAMQDESEGEEEQEDDAGSDDEEDGSARKKSKSADGSASAAAKARSTKALLSRGIRGGAPSELVDLVLLSLRDCFSFDSHHFLDKYHFQLLTAPMVQQVQHAFDTRRTQAAGATGKHAHEAYDEFVGEVLTPTIVQMAIRMGNYLQWKPLVSALLLHARSPSPQVRRACVYIFCALFTGVGDHLLVVLPELLPAIAELREDPDAGVERQTGQLVKIIEKMSGESLDATLNGE